MIGIIAGAGELPVMAMRALKQSKEAFFVISVCDENNGKQLVHEASSSHEYIAMDKLKVGAILELLKQKSCTHILFIGKVEKQILLKKASLDWLGIKLLSSLVGKSDRQIMERLISFLAKHNIRTLSQSEVLAPLHARPGLLSGAITKSIQQDITLGMHTAQNISSADIGQTVVVKHGMILAVEAIEGTDKCIKRGIDLGEGNVVVCKAARLDHNRQYDLPTLGPKTLESITPGQIAAIAWQSSHTLIVEQNSFIAHAQSRNITLIAV